MPKTYATVDDYVAEFGEPSDRDKLVQLLADATRLIDSALWQHFKEARDVDRSNLMQACRSVAHRAYGDKNAIPPGISQYTMSAAPYSETLTVANPDSAAWLNKSEKMLLGIAGRARLASVPLGWS